MIFYRHKKTGKTYRMLAAGVDCTNVRNGTAVVIYCPNDELNTIYVREKEEFYAKFEALETDHWKTGK